MVDDFPALVSENLELRFSRNDAEVRASQKLRHCVFMEEMGALSKHAHIDKDAFDPFCDHLLVIDTRRPVNDQVVGTYRLLRKERAAQIGQFYSESEYNLQPLLEYKGHILEVGRSCVHKDYRQSSTMKLLWRGLAQYSSLHDIDILFGCASFPGIDITIHKHLLAYLYHYHLAPPPLCVYALPEKAVSLNLCTRESIQDKSTECLAQLPPLIKGYLRAGGLVGADAVIDHEFNTVDIFILVQMKHLSNRYDQYFRPQGVT